jgi:glycosyltransferase involved in cell wall biosynthesis
MRILMVLTYYRPHVSGLTIYAQRLAEGLVRRGHQVTVLATRHRPDLPLREELNGVQVRRSRTLFRVYKGVISPAFLLDGFEEIVSHEVVNLHLPLMEAAFFAPAARLMGRPVVITYHCDLNPPWSLLTAAAVRALWAMHWLGAGFANRLVTYTQDYATHSAFVSRWLMKTRTFYPPVIMERPPADKVDAFYRNIGSPSRPLIGFAGRIAAEKGIGYLLEAFLKVREEFPSAHLLLAGEYLNVVGENEYHRLKGRLEALQPEVRLLGNLEGEALASFFTLIDVLTLPSLNSTESFGLVQVEAMLCGTPVVASDLPGVRQPVLVTGMGEIARPASSDDLAEKILRVIKQRERYLVPREKVEAIFDPEATYRFYEGLFAELVPQRSS